MCLPLRRAVLLAFSKAALLQPTPALTIRDIHHGLSDACPCVQAQLSRLLPLCLATLLGTHNSGITIADGYGNRDEYFQEYFKWIRWVVSALVGTVLDASVPSL